jgi:Domain of unknown function (DUF4351)/Putative transposase, YhgA-like
MAKEETDNINHDRLFKELFRTFFIQFLELFAPKMLNYLDTTSLVFLDKETFNDPLSGERKDADLVVRGNYKGKANHFIIHLENQATAQADFNFRMFLYFARLVAKYGKEVYPIVVFSYDKPYKAATSQFKIEFEDLQALRFNFRVVQLNRLGWRKYLNKPNPVASALMAKMKIAPPDRAKVKAEALKMLTGLGLNDVEKYLVSGFIGTYLKLDEKEQVKFERELEKNMSTEQKEEALVIVTDWMERGMELGKEEMILRQLKHRVGVLTSQEEKQIKALSVSQLDELGEALLDFADKNDFINWMAQH